MMLLNETFINEKDEKLKALEMVENQDGIITLKQKLLTVETVTILDNL